MTTENAIDRELAGTSERLREQQRTLQSVHAQAESLKKSIKQLKDRRETLRDKRKNARKHNGKARKKLEAAEAKYERSVVDEMVRREKMIDLSEHSAPATSARSLPSGDSPPVAAIGRAGQR
jgi:septal ring factor EnvC (AmiA/AmiB activator)